MYVYPHINLSWYEVCLLGNIDRGQDVNEKVRKIKKNYSLKLAKM